MKRKHFNRKFIIVILILFISIGFAYLTTNLGINGISIIKKTVWDVHFENVVNESEDVLTINKKATISNNKLKVDFEVTLDQPGQEYSFYVDVVNNSTFDLMMDTISISGLTTAQEKWIKPTVTYSDGISLQQYDVLKEGSKEVLHVSVKYLDDLTSSELPTTDTDFNISIEITYTQSDSNSKEINHIEYVTRAADNLISIGDEIKIGTEHFYIVSSDEDKTVLFAKYNLYVGKIFELENGNPTSWRTISNDEAGYLLQNPNVLSSTQRIGSVPFSTQKYWVYEENLKSEYGSSYDDNNIYEPSLDSKDGDNYSVAYYVKEYLKKLSEIGLNNMEGRLLTSKEGYELVVNEEYKSMVYDGTFYWLGSAYSDTLVNMVYGNNIYRDSNISSRLYGVRPVIEIPTSYLKTPRYIPVDYNGAEAFLDELLVIDNKKYGIIPTPTREEYTFLG